MLHIVARLLESFAGVSTHKHNVIWLERIGNTRQFCLDISAGNPFAAVLVSHVQDYTITEAPAQRYLIDSASLTMTSWPIVCGCVNMSTRVSRECYLLDCPGLPVWPECTTYAQALFGYHNALFWCCVLNSMTVQFKG